MYEITLKAESVGEAIVLLQALTQEQAPDSGDQMRIVRLVEGADGFRKRIAELEQLVERMEVMLEQSQSKRERLQEQLAEMEQERDRLKEALKEMEQERDYLEARLEEEKAKQDKPPTGLPWEVRYWFPDEYHDAQDYRLVGEGENDPAEMVLALRRMANRIEAWAQSQETERVEGYRDCATCRHKDGSTYLEPCSSCEDTSFMTRWRPAQSQPKEQT